MTSAFRPRGSVIWAARITVAVALATAVAGQASAWNQLRPPGDPNQPIPCEDTVASPCIEWRKTGSNLSINVDVYLSNLLSQEEIDLKVDVRNTFPKWNEIDARNPHLQETSSSSNEEVWVSTEAMDWFYWAGTTHGISAGPGYKINSSVVKFNSDVIWNRSYNYACLENQAVCAADARKVSMHEMGHVEGLGHQHPDSSTVAIMQQHARNYWWPRVDDHNGIIAIYGAYP